MLLMTALAPLALAIIIPISYYASWLLISKIDKSQNYLTLSNTHSTITKLGKTITDKYASK